MKTLFFHPDYDCRRLRFFFFAGFLSMLSCSGPEEPNSKEVSERHLKEPMVKANELLVRNESDRINALIARYQWDMKATGTGLRYMFIHKGRGKMPEKGMTAVADYQVHLMDGKEIYNSERDGQLRFELGKGEVINGLEEAIFLMHVGDRAKFIIPSHLAFGLLGDQDRIPQKATLIYDLSLMDLDDNKPKNP